MIWKNLIKKISSNYHFKNPATNLEVELIKAELNVEIPKELKELFKETNGVYDEFNSPLIWSTSQIIKDNLFYRNSEEYKDNFMAVDQLLFFSDAGNGDLFGYAIINGSIQRPDIYVWNHENDSRIWISSSLEEFLKGWITGELSI